MYSTSAMLGRNHRVRNTPVRRSTTKLHSAISPSMNDQWSGKTLRRFFLAIVARPRRSSVHSTAAAPLLRFLALAAFLPLVAATPFSSLIQPRSQKLGPIGSVKSLRATR